jgi:hypothetical protein
LSADNLAGRGGEVECCAPRLESQVVGAEKPLENLTTPREALEDVDRREWDMKEETDPGVGEPLPDQGRDELELVIVDPDLPTCPGGTCGGASEPLVDFLMGIPPVPVELEGSDGIVIEGPNGPIAEAVVVILDL